ncbi:MAG: hypothetical protein JSW00_03765 [Thermoplasmata archaeon]|nr:MAG: hypothetical protein JSW00_03765 [Thermoplasmata archaeon]
MLKASAFAPAHVTGFFEIHDEAEDLRKRGSRGVGICLTRGIHTNVEVSESEKQDIEVFINNKKMMSPVTEFVVQRLMSDDCYKIKVKSELDLPLGQGFGMSGANALSTSFALAKALNLELSKDDIVCVAHQAEIACRTGLGDVTPQSIGGMVIRKKEGCPPFGVVEKIECEDVEIVLCVVGKELSTRDIITDPEHRRNINKYGEESLKQLVKMPKLWEAIWLSLAFSKGTGLMSQDMEKAVMAARNFGLVSMAMLGNSVFAIGDTKNLVNALQDFGEVYTCRIDRNGARIVAD